MTDEQKARDAAIEKLQNECDHPLSDFERHLIEAAFDAAIAHAEAENTERVKALVDALTLVEVELGNTVQALRFSRL